MLYAGLDVSRKRVHFDARRAGGELAERGAAPVDADGLRGLAERLLAHDPEVLAVVESMNGARFVHDQLERYGIDVLICDAERAKALAPLACKTDEIDAHVLEELGRRDLVPEIWLPDPATRADRERARFRLHLVRKRTALKNRVRSTLVTWGKPCPVSDLFGRSGRELLSGLEIPEPWSGTLEASLRLIDQLDAEITAQEHELRRLGADHRYIPLLTTVPAIAWVLGFTIACEIGDIERFASPKKLTGYTGLCPKVDQSGEHDWRGRLKKNGPRYLRWALIEAAHNAGRSACYRELYRRTKKRHGKQRGGKVAAIVVARKLAGAIWHMLTYDKPFTPASATASLAA
jgi:transposase